MSICPNCQTTDLQEPLDAHPSYMICPTCQAIQLTYVPQSHQEALHQAPQTLNPDQSLQTQIIGVFGGYGSSKSRASLQEIFLRALENPGGTGLLTAPTLQLLKRTTLKTLLDEVIPPPLIENYNKSETEFKLVNGFTFYGIPSDDEEKLRSINAGLIHMEEASGIKQSIFVQLQTRMRDPFVKNKLLIVCSNPDLGWIKDVIVLNQDRANPNHPQHQDYNPQITSFIWETSQNKYLPADFIPMISKGKPEWWIKRYIKGSFDHAEGMVYPNIQQCFTSQASYPVEKGTDKYGIPLAWERFVTMDHGIRNATAIYFHAIDPKKGEVITYNEYYQSNRVVPEHVKYIKPLLDEIPAGRIRFMVADPSIRNRSDPITGKSVQGLYAEYGIFWQEGNNSLDAGILKVNAYIEAGKWKIIRERCPELCKELVNYKYPEVTIDQEKNLDERPVKRNDHGCDSVRYGFMRLPDDVNLLKSVAFEPTREYNKYKDKEYMADDEDDDPTPIYSGSYMDYV